MSTHMSVSGFTTTSITCNVSGRSCHSYHTYSDYRIKTLRLYEDGSTEESECLEPVARTIHNE